MCETSCTVSAPAGDFCSRRQETIAHHSVPSASYMYVLALPESAYSPAGMSTVATVS